jgi:copper(I)-binding protein
MARMMFFMFAVIGAMFVAACEPEPQLRVEGAVVQVSPIEGRPSAAYFTIIGGPDSTALLDVNSPQVLRMEIHETIDEDGMAMMRQIQSVAVPSKGKVAFEPGGKHVMIWGVSASAQKAGLLPLQFVFANGDRIEVDANIRKMGGAALDDEAVDHDGMEGQVKPAEQRPEA